MSFTKLIILVTALAVHTFAAPVAQRAAINLDTCQHDLGAADDAVGKACAVAGAACNNAIAAVVPAIASCGSIAEAKTSDSTSFATGVASAKGVSCADAADTAFNNLFFGCTGGSEFAPLVQSAGCDKARVTLLGLVSAACPAASDTVTNASGTLSSAAAAGSAAAAVQSATAEFKDDTAKLETAPSADNCDRNLGSVTDEVQKACSISSSVDGAAAACATATGQALSRITPVCGTVADVQKSNSAAFQDGVKQAKGTSCTDATNNAFNALFDGCTGGSEFAPFIESAGCDNAKATVLGLVSTACPAST